MNWWNITVCDLKVNKNYYVNRKKWNIYLFIINMAIWIWGGVVKPYFFRFLRYYLWYEMQKKSSFLSP